MCKLSSGCGMCELGGGGGRGWGCMIRTALVMHVIIRYCLRGSINFLVQLLHIVRMMS